MGWRTWNAYEELAAEERRRLPLRQRYAWGRIAWISAILIALAIALLSRVAGL